MGWWESEDGRGFVGDGPADILGAALGEALGDSFDPDLFAGFLSALGAALLRNPLELTAETRSLEQYAIAVQYGDQPPMIVPVRPAPRDGGLEDALFDALESIAFQYRISEIGRPPTLAELLETTAFVARGHIVEDGTSLALRAIRPVERNHA
jgi:hypothetical protein